MAKADDLLKDMIRFHGKRVAKDVVGDLPAQMKQARQDIRSLQKELTALTRKVDQLLNATRTEPPVPIASEEEVEKGRYTKRTLPALRKRFGLTQQELAKLLQVGQLTISSWERGKSKPRAGSLAKIIALRSMTQGQVDTALGREKALSTAMSPQQIKDIRQGKGMSRAGFAKLVGVSASAVATWEQGKSAPGARSREALARIKDMGQGEGNEQAGQKGTSREAGESAPRTELSPEEILEIRQKAGLSQRGFAKMIGASVNSICNWEKGHSKPRAGNLEKLLAMGK